MSIWSGCCSRWWPPFHQPLCSCPACVGFGYWNCRSPSGPRSGRLWGGNKFLTSSLSTQSLSSDSTAKGGRSLHERDLLAGESYDKKNDSHPPSFRSDLHTRHRGECHSSPNWYHLCTRIDKQGMFAHATAGEGLCPWQDREGQTERGLGLWVLCHVSFSEWP